MFICYQAKQVVELDAEEWLHSCASNTLLKGEACSSNKETRFCWQGIDLDAAEWVAFASGIEKLALQKERQSNFKPFQVCSIRFLSVC